MKNIKQLLMLLFIITVFLPLYSKKKTITSIDHKKSSSIQQIMQHVKKISLPVAIGTIAYMHKDNIIDFVHQHQYTAILSSYLFLNYICDSFMTYHKAKKALHLLDTAKRTSRCILAAIIIENHMKQYNLEFSQQEHYRTVTQYIDSSFKNIERYIKDIFKNIHLIMKQLSMHCNADIEEEVLLLFSQHVTIEHSHIISKNDSEVKQLLHYFCKDPEKNYLDTITTLSLYMKDRVSIIEQINK